MRTISRRAYNNVFSGDDIANYITSLNPLGFWKLNEISGTNVLDSSGNAYNGTYDDVTLNSTSNPYGKTSPLFVPANAPSIANVYSASLASAFGGDEMNECTLFVMIKPRNVSVWSDGNARYIYRFAVNSNNQIIILKPATANSINILHVGSSTGVTVSNNTFTTVDWYGVSVAIGSGSIQMYVNGSQVDSDTGLGTSSGSLNSAFAVIGGISTVGTSNDNWDGYLSYASLWNRKLDPSEIAGLKV